MRKILKEKNYENQTFAKKLEIIRSLDDSSQYINSLKIGNDRY